MRVIQRWILLLEDFIFSFWNVLRIFFLYIIYGHSAVSMCQKNVLSVLAVFWNLVYYLSVRLYILWTLYINGGISWAEFSLMGKAKNRLLSYIRCLACLKGTMVGNIILPPPVAVCSSANLMSVHKDLKKDDSVQWGYQCIVGVPLSTHSVAHFIVLGFRGLQRALWKSWSLRDNYEPGSSPFHLRTSRWGKDEGRGRQGGSILNPDT